MSLRQCCTSRSAKCQVVPLMCQPTSRDFNISTLDQITQNLQFCFTARCLKHWIHCREKSFPSTLLTH